METLSASPPSGFGGGKELAAAGTRCYGMGTPGSETRDIFEGEGFSFAYAMMMRSKGSPVQGT